MNIYSLITLNIGLTISLVGIVVVFSSLIILYAIFSQLPKLIHIKIRSRLKKQGKHIECTDTACYSIEGNVSAAISAAIHLYFDEMHDLESNIITIKNISKRYSPWSSKIYNVQNQPIKR